MRSMFKDHILVAEALSRNPEECQRFLSIVFGEVSGLQLKLSETSVHAPFCIRVNEPSRFPLQFSSQVGLWRLLVKLLVKWSPYFAQTIYSKFSYKISQNHATEFTPGNAVNIDRDGERSQDLLPFPL